MENDDWEHASYEAQHRPSCDYCNSMAARLDADSNDREAYLNLKNCRGNQWAVGIVVLTCTSLALKQNTALLATASMARGNANPPAMAKSVSVRHQRSISETRKYWNKEVVGGKAERPFPKG